MAQAEIKSIIKKRNHFEYALKRIGSEKEDYLRYIQYEMNLNILQKKRKKKLGTAGPSPSAALLFFLLHCCSPILNHFFCRYARDLFCLIFLTI